MPDFTDDLTESHRLRDEADVLSEDVKRNGIHFVNTELVIVWLRGPANPKQRPRLCNDLEFALGDYGSELIFLLNERTRPESGHFSQLSIEW
jgi:hypothetical protein